MQAQFSGQTTQNKVSTNPSQVHHTNVEAVAVKNLLHPALDSQFKAIETMGDNNCLWNAICLCLGLPEYNQVEFRNITFSTICEHEEHFKTLLRPHPYETIHTVKDACMHSNSSAGWGNEYHLLALAIALDRNIYVYSTFKDSTTGRFFQNARLDISKLASMFANKVAQTSQHRNYQPTQDIISRSPICLFYDHPHYTALVPRVSSPIYCIPHEVIVQSIKLGMQNVVEVPSDTLRQNASQGNQKSISLTQTDCSKKDQPKQLKSHDRLRKNENVVEPTCDVSNQSTTQEIQKPNTRNLTHSNKGQSKWSKWYNNLSKDEKIAYNQRKAKSKSAEIKSAQNRKYYEKNAEVIRKKQKESYSNPITRENKKAVSKQKRQETYATVEGKEKMKGDSRNRYGDPIIKESKKARSRQRKKEMYATPEGKEKMKDDSRKRYGDPIIKESKKARSRQRQKEMYATPEGKEKMKGDSRKRYGDPIIKESKKVRSGQIQKEMYATPEGKEKKKDDSRKRYGDPIIKESKKARSRQRKKEMYATPEGKEKMKDDSRKRYGDLIIKEAKRARSRQKQKEMYATPEGKEKIKADSRKRFDDPKTKEVNKARSSQRQKEMYADPEQKKKIKAGSRKRQNIKRNEKKKSEKDINYLLQQANLAMQEFPALACTVCHRARFREQVIPCRRSKYSKTLHIQNAMTGDYIHKCDTECSDTSKYHTLKMNEWICFTCDRHLKKGDIPPQAIVNGLRLDPIPEELKVLNPLEKHLISIIQPFQKIVPLPKGGQKGVRGQMVCVPADLQKTADTLPWTPDQNSLVKVKLKRKLNYKGHHLYMSVSQDNIMKALMKLKEINPHYANIEINENTE